MPGSPKGSGANLGQTGTQLVVFTSSIRSIRVVCLRNQGGPPDFRHCCRGSAKLADLELPFLDLLESSSKSGGLGGMAAVA